MANLTTAEANAILNASSGQAVYTNPTTPIKVSLNNLTTAPTTLTPGSEISGGSYARQTITFNLASSNSISSSVAITYTNMPATTVHSVDEWDSSGTPVRRWFGLLTSDKVVNAGDTFTIAAGSYTKTLN